MTYVNAGTDVSGIQSVGTAIKLGESRSLSITAAQLGVTKTQIIRGVIRFAMANPHTLYEWLANNKEKWINY